MCVSVCVRERESLVFRWSLNHTHTHTHIWVTQWCNTNSRWKIIQQQKHFTCMYSLNITSVWLSFTVLVTFSVHQNTTLMPPHPPTSRFCPLNTTEQGTVGKRRPTPPPKKPQSGHQGNDLPLICANNWLLNPGDWERGKIKSRIFSRAGESSRG